MDYLCSIRRRELTGRICKDYNLAILRLKCHSQDEYHGMEPNYLVQDVNVESPMYACKFSSAPSCHHILALANEDGKIGLQDTNIKSRNEYTEGFLAHNNAIFDVTWMEGEQKLVTASGDQTAALWDVSGPAFTHLTRFQGHTRSVKTAIFRPQDKAVIVTGARDGMIMIWDSRCSHGTLQKKPDNFISNAHDVPADSFPSKSKRGRTTTCANCGNSITGLVFQDENSLISCGAGDGIIKVWDLRKNYSAYRGDPLPKHKLPYPGKTAKNGFTSVELDPGKMKLYANCMDNNIYCYNVSTYESKPVARFYGHRNSTFYVKCCLSPDGRYLLSGSTDTNAYIWNTSQPGRPIAKLQGHRAEVTCVAWCPTGDVKIVTCSDDFRYRIWKVAPEEGEDDGFLLRGWAESVSQTDEEFDAVNNPESSSPTNNAAFETPKTFKKWVQNQERTPKASASETVDMSPQDSCGSNSNSSSMSALHLCSPFSLFQPRGFGGLSLKDANEGENIENKLPATFSELCEGGNASVAQRSSGDKRKVLSPVKTDSGENICGTVRKGRNLFGSDSGNGDNMKEVDLGVEKISGTVCEKRQVNRLEFSPTLNLPNFVVDGQLPRRQCSSSAKKNRQVDWLTKLKQERKRAKSVDLTPRSAQRRSAVKRKLKTENISQFFTKST